MSANKIIDVKFIKTIVKSGRGLSVEYATKTDAWNRIYLADNVKTGFVKAVENAEVPANATKAVLAYVAPMISTGRLSVLTSAPVKKSIRA
jgi:hypothetical protein